jgi:hypothetical protein
VKRLWSRYLWLFEDMVQLGVCEKYFGERIRIRFWFGLSWLRETFE